MLSQSCPVALPGMIRRMPHMSFISCRVNSDTAKDLLDALHQVSFDPALVSSFEGVLVFFSTMAC